MTLPPLPDLSQLSSEEKDALVRALERVGELTFRVSELEAKRGEPPKTPENSSVPPSRGQKANRDKKPKREGPRAGSVGRKGGGDRWPRSPTRPSSPRPRVAVTAGRRWARAIKSCTDATIRSICRRCARL